MKQRLLADLFIDPNHISARISSNYDAEQRSTLDFWLYAVASHNWGSVGYDGGCEASVGLVSSKHQPKVKVRLHCTARSRGNC